MNDVQAEQYIDRFKSERMTNKDFLRLLEQMSATKSWRTVAAQIDSVEVNAQFGPNVKQILNFVVKSPTILFEPNENESGKAESEFIIAIKDPHNRANGSFWHAQCMHCWIVGSMKQLQIKGNELDFQDKDYSCVYRVCLP